MAFELRDYQKKTEKSIIAFLKGKETKGIIVSPVATGKSIYTGLFAKYSNKPTLVLQPKKELLEQNYDKALKYGLEPTIYSHSLGKKENSNLVYATPLTVANNPEEFKHIENVIIDECHLGLTRTIRGGKIERVSKIEEFLNIINPKKVLGITATPLRLVNGKSGSRLVMINRDRGSYFNKAKIISVTQVSDIKDKYWCDYEFKTQPDYDDRFLVLNSAGSEFTPDSIIRNFNENGGTKKIMSTIDLLLNVEGKANVLVFLPSLEHGHELVRLDKRVVLLDNLTTREEREVILKDFRDGKIKVLLNYGVLTTGYDYPDLESIIIARDTASYPLYYQIVGRVVRPFIASKVDRATIYDLTSNYKRFGDVDSIKFKELEEVKGWCMMNKDKVITGFTIVGDMKYPTLSQLKERLRKERKLIKKKIKGEKSIEFRFGKYRGKTVREVARFHMTYLKWCLEEIDFKKFGAYGHILKKQMENEIRKKDYELSKKRS